AEADRDGIRRGRDRGEPGRAPRLPRQEGESGALVESRHLRAEGRLMIPRSRRGGWALLAAVLLAVAARTSRAQDLTCGPGDVEVMKLTFQGNHAFASGGLGDGIVTAPSGFLRRTIRIGPRPCLAR